MVGLVTDGTKEKILRDDPEKLKEEVKAKQHELGLESMVPLGKQNSYQQLKDMTTEAGHINDIMSQTHETNKKKREDEHKARRKTAKEQLRMILAYEERKSKEAYESRKIKFAGGGFEDYEDVIRMMPERVLLKKLDAPLENGGIVRPDNAVDSQPKYVVVRVCEDNDDVQEGDIVMVEKYAGIEIDSGSNIYLILFSDEIVCVIEE